jgi:hypothetical protein
LALAVAWAGFEGGKLIGKLINGTIKPRPRSRDDKDLLREETLRGRSIMVLQILPILIEQYKRYKNKANSNWGQQKSYDSQRITRMSFYPFDLLFRHFRMKPLFKWSLIKYTEDRNRKNSNPDQEVYFIMSQCVDVSFSTCRSVKNITEVVFDIPIKIAHITIIQNFMSPGIATLTVGWNETHHQIKIHGVLNRKPTINAAIAIRKHSAKLAIVISYCFSRIFMTSGGVFLENGGALYDAFLPHV